MVTMTVYSEVKRLYSSLQETLSLRRRKRPAQISDPFNFKKEPTALPGFTEDEITILREKAAASRLGLAPSDTLPQPPSHIHQIGYNHHHRANAKPFTGSRTPSGPLSLSPPPPRLSIPMPIPIPNVVGLSAERHGSSGESSLRSCRTVASELGGRPRWMGAEGQRVSVSMEELDLLLFGEPSGVSTVVPVPRRGGSGVVGGEEGREVSSLERDVDVTGGVDWEMEFEFQMGSSVSPVSPVRGVKV